MLHVFRQAGIVLILGLLVLPACSRVLEDLAGMGEDAEVTSGDPADPGGGDPIPDPQPDPDPTPDPDPQPDPTPDPDPGTVTVSLESSTETIPEGQAGSLPVRLSGRPDSDVTVSAEFVNNSAGIVLDGPSQLVFTPDNWDQPQSFAFSAPQDDDSTDGVATLELLLGGAQPVLVTLIVADDEAPTGEGIQLTVKDGSFRGATHHPVLAVVPLPYGQFQSTDRFRVTDADGGTVPAQFEVLNRWWARDNSLRHVVVQFQATVASDGEATYFFKSDGVTNPTPAKPVSVTTSGDVVTVDTGVLRFKINKAVFNLFDEAHLDTNGDGSYSSAERIVAPGTSEGPVFTGRLAGDIQRAQDRGDIRVVVEEEGPMRAVVRVSSLTKFHSTENHEHGFAVRFYAYAGKSYVKVDYQLQNSAKNVRFSWPLYMNDLSLHVKPELSNPTVRISPRDGEVWEGSLSGGRSLAQTSLKDAVVRNVGGGSLASAVLTPGDSSFGWADLSDSNRGLAVMVRHMAEMWPNGIDLEGDGNVAVRLWPEWSEQWHDGAQSSTGMYWLDDMQHVVKEMLYYFHGSGVGNAELETLAFNFQYHPVVRVAPSAYVASGASMDLDGVFPQAVGPAGEDTKRVAPRSSSRTDPTESRNYNYGWLNFGGDVGRRASMNPGDWPAGGAHFLATGNVSKYFADERQMWGDLNCRPLWLAEYTHDDDFETVMPTENPYGSKTWRNFRGHGASNEPIAAPYLTGTERIDWRPRDNMHCWLYHVEDFYYTSGNPWIRDWYEWIGNFRKRTLFRKPEFASEKPGAPGDDLFEWGWATRGEGHMLSNSVQAYRVTGDPQLLDAIKARIDYMLKNTTRRVFQRRWGNITEPSKGGEAAFQMGFWTRALHSCLTEMRDTDPEYEAKTYLMLWAAMDWLENISLYDYYKYPNDPITDSSRTSLSMVDSVALWYARSGRTDHYDLLVEYMTNGLNGGKPPWGRFNYWAGDWEGRAWQYVQQNPRTPNPPPAVTDLQASVSGGNVRIEWTAPARAKRYFVVWSTRPIARDWDPSDSVTQFWAGEVVPTDLEAVPGTSQSIEFGGVPAGTKIYVALASISEDHDLSGVSNVVSVTTP